MLFSSPTLPRWSLSHAMLLGRFAGREHAVLEPSITGRADRIQYLGSAARTGYEATLLIRLWEVRDYKCIDSARLTVRAMERAATVRLRAATPLSGRDEGLKRNCAGGCKTGSLSR